ncbi:hypothetical protein F4779DRAFT_391076 [Xylariaceae sp. FL0662B]|nr:hypothetical protein F4779DRAFT_391076 [Xylariaceae sp. FL0662B]
MGTGGHTVHLGHSYFRPFASFLLLVSPSLCIPPMRLYETATLRSDVYVGRDLLVVGHESRRCRSLWVGLGLFSSCCWPSLSERKRARKRKGKTR